MPMETTTAICCMVMGGVLQNFPSLKVCFAHGGGAYPFTIGRIEHGILRSPRELRVLNYLTYFFRLQSEARFMCYKLFS